MDYSKKLIILSIFITILIAGPAYGDDYQDMKKLPRISAQNAYILFQQKKMTIFDTHPGQNKASVLGAYYLDKSKIDKIKLKLPKEQFIGVYCD